MDMKNKGFTSEMDITNKNWESCFGNGHIKKINKKRCFGNEHKKKVCFGNRHKIKKKKNMLQK